MQNASRMSTDSCLSRNSIISNQISLVSDMILRAEAEWNLVPLARAANTSVSSSLLPFRGLDWQLGFKQQTTERPSTFLKQQTTELPPNLPHLKYFFRPFLSSVPCSFFTSSASSLPLAVLLCSYSSSRLVCIPHFVPISITLSQVWT